MKFNASQQVKIILQITKIEVNKKIKFEIASSNKHDYEMQYYSKVQIKVVTMIQIEFVDGNKC